MIKVTFLAQELLDLGLSIHELFLNFTDRRPSWLIVWNRQIPRAPIGLMALGLLTASLFLLTVTDELEALI